MSRLLAASQAAIALVFVGAGCSAILGIEDAELKPDSSAASGGAGGTSGTGGTSSGGSGTGGAGTGGAGTGGAGTGGAGTGGGGTGGSAGAAGAAGAPNTLCEEYCDATLTNCKDDLEVYPNRAICLALCATMEEGQPDDKNVDTIHCRLNQALAAKGTIEPEAHCPFSGLGGGNVCGDNCTALCRAMLTVCKGEWASNTACLQDCSMLEDKGGFDTSQNRGLSVQCRMWHVGAATQEDYPHCGHAAGAGPCSEPE